MTSSPENWAPVIREIDRRYPAFTRISFGSVEGTESSSLIGFQKVMFRIADQLALGKSGSERLAVVAPKRLDLAIWTAVLYALERSRIDYETAIKNLPPLEPGQRMLLDKRWVVEFSKVESTGGKRLLWFWMGGDRARRGFTEEDRLRFQPTTTNRRLTPILRKETFHPPPPSVLERVLGIETRGNLSIFKSRVVVVTTIARGRRLATEISARCAGDGKGAAVKLDGLFQWGNLGEDGSLNRWGQSVIPADPILTLAPDLATAIDFLKSPQGNTVSLLVLDGASSYSSAPHLLDESVGRPVLSVLDFADIASIKPLTDRAFKVTAWVPQEIDDALATSGPEPTPPSSPFSIMSRSLLNYGRFELREYDCVDAAIEESSENLEMLDSILRRQKSLFQEQVGLFYECLLMGARLVHQPPVETNPGSWTDRFTRKLTNLDEELSRNKIWLTKEAHDLAKTVITSLRSVVPRFALGRNGKLETLRAILEDNFTKGETVCLVLTSPEDVEPTEKLWTSRLGEGVRFSVRTPSMIDPNLDYRAIIVAGWLNWQKMSDLWDAPLSPVQHLLLYPFERLWFESARRKWEGIRQPKTNRVSKVSILGDVATGMDGTSRYLDQGKPNEDSGKESFDIAEFEFRLRAFRRHALVRDAVAHENNVDAKYVEFSEGHYAFLTEGHRLRVVSDFLSGKAKPDSEIPTKGIVELRSGDFVIFREGGSGDVIRVMADRALANSGMQDLREIARLWKEALTSKAREMRRGASELVIWLKAYGCTRTDSTIRRWIREDPEDFQIGPGAEEDLKRIAEATKHRGLTTRLDEVWRAIERVRSAHLQASGHLADLMLKQIPKHLGQISGGAFPVDVEGVGRAWVLQIESISTEADSVAASKINRLLRGE